MENSDDKVVDQEVDKSIPTELKTIADLNNQTVLVPVLPDSLTHKQRAFLQAYAICGQVRRAALIGDWEASCHYRKLASDKEYKEAFLECKRLFNEALEAKAIKLALGLEVDDVWYKGRVVGKKAVRSERLLEFLLRANFKKYRQDRNITNISQSTTVEATGDDIDVTIDSEYDEEYLDGEIKRLFALQMDSGKESLDSGSTAGTEQIATDEVDPSLREGDPES